MSDSEDDAVSVWVAENEGESDGDGVSVGVGVIVAVGDAVALLLSDDVPVLERELLKVPLHERDVVVVRDDVIVGVKIAVTDIITVRLRVIEEERLFECVSVWEPVPLKDHVTLSVADHEREMVAVHECVLLLVTMLTYTGYEEGVVSVPRMAEFNCDWQEEPQMLPQDCSSKMTCGVVKNDTDVMETTPVGDTLIAMRNVAERDAVVVGTLHEELTPHEYPPIQTPKAEKILQ